MDDPARVRGGERVGDLDRDGQRALHVQGPARHELLERLALDVLHDDVGHAVELADVVDAGYVGMVERGAQAGLAVEAAAGGPAVEVGPEHLDDDRTMEAEVLGLERIGLAALPQPFDDSVVGEDAARFELSHGAVPLLR